MIWEDVYLAGTGSSFAPEVSVESAIAENRYDSEEAGRSKQLALTVAGPEVRSPDFAVAAARQALERAGRSVDEAELLLYAVLMHNGIDVWNATSYVQRELGAANALISEVRNGSNGGLTGLELACSHLRARPGAGVAVVTASDCWRDPVFDRWRADSGLVFGDGGSAVVVSRESGFARLVSLCTTTDSSLEGLHRGVEEFGPFQHNPERPIDLFRRAQEFMRAVPKEEVWQRHNDGLRAAVDQALEEGKVAIGDVEHVVMPFFGAHLLARQCLEPLGLKLEQTTWEYGRRIGHIGAGDQFAGLDHLVSSGALGTGDRVLLIGVGGGFTWTAALLETLETPAV